MMPVFTPNARAGKCQLCYHTFTSVETPNKFVFAPPGSHLLFTLITVNTDLAAIVLNISFNPLTFGNSLLASAVEEKGNKAESFDAWLSQSLFRVCEHVLVISLRALSWDRAERHSVGVFPDDRAGHLHPAECHSFIVITVCDEQTARTNAHSEHCAGTLAQREGLEPTGELLSLSEPVKSLFLVVIYKYI